MKVVGIGGGHGLATTLRAARMYADEVAAVVTVADDGGSSGRLTRDLGIPPPGDIRNCLAALSEEGPASELFQHRFSSGELEGHPVGNLVIAALAEMQGDFGAAVAEAGRLLGARGRVFPATTDLVSLHAEVDGGVVEGQVAVAQTSSPIRSVYLKPTEPSAYGPAVDALLDADQIVLGPGSLFTSVIATLLVPGIAEALGAAPGRRIFVCNARPQPGETEGMSVSDHISALAPYLGSTSLDVVVVQDPAIPGGLDPETSSQGGLEVIGADVVDPDGGHVPERLAKVLASA